MNVDVIDYGELDPGIRDVVRLLREAGFETTDSGDGVSKPADDLCVLNFPHVFAVCAPAEMVPEAHRMLDVLGPGWDVEVSYKPNSSAILCASKGAQEAARAKFTEPEVPCATS